MKIVVIGGTGLIGSRLVSILRSKDHEVLAASPDSGVDTITGDGLDAALAGAQVVVDVANSRTFDDAAVTFFETSGKNLLAAERRAGVGHHVALSIVGTDRVPGSVYLRAKMIQENLIKQSGIPYSIDVHVSNAMFQPILSADVVATLADIAVGTPLNDTVEVGGPEQFHMDELVRRVLRANGDLREVIGDTHAHYFGAELTDQSLVAGPSARIGSKHFEEWLSEATPARR
jgi:uncharacterized protein YbjT (DUF2867 family)